MDVVPHALQRALGARLLLIVPVGVGETPKDRLVMIPGWTHNIINLSDTEDLVTVMTCNEIFNPDRPDTFFEKV